MIGRIEAAGLYKEIRQYTFDILIFAGEETLRPDTLPFRQSH
jgi:hypothetical protein